MRAHVTARKMRNGRCFLRIASSRKAGAATVLKVVADTEAAARASVPADLLPLQRVRLLALMVSRRTQLTIKAEADRKRWRAANKKRDKARRNQWFALRRQTDPAFKLNGIIRSAIYKSLRGAKARVNWSTLVGYSLPELRAHLEAQFIDGMAWANCGEWHIDHIRPLASFQITDATCDDFKAAWALSNLQPLWGPDNLSKGAKWSP